MKQQKRTKNLRKDLKLLDVYAITTGTTLSAGFFLLPALASQQIGPAIIISYLIAFLPLIPAMFSIVELTTAMPKAGGMYFSLDRTLGPLFGTIGGLGTWLSLLLKVSFALIGMGAYLIIFMDNYNIETIAVLLALLLGAINILGVKKGSILQILLVLIILIALFIFFSAGIFEIQINNFEGMVNFETSSILSTAGMVYISYVGVAKIASVSEEIKNPAKNLPLGVFLSIGTTILVYGIGTTVMVGVLPQDALNSTLTPVADTARLIFGEWGYFAMAIVACLAFISMANAGTMSASRYPLAMSRDFIMPHSFKKINKFGTPTLSIVTTVILIILAIVVFEPIKIAKLAAAFQLLLNGLICLAVIVMRESRIESYDPSFPSPLYPWMQIFGIIVSFWLIAEMGTFPILFSLGLALTGFLWYWFYAKNKVERNGAIYHIFERLGRASYKGLDIELRGILKEKGLRDDDPFDDMITRSYVLDLKEDISFDDVIDQASAILDNSTNLSFDEIKQGFIEGNKYGATPFIGGVALPHFRSKYIKQTELVLVRSKNGIQIQTNFISDYNNSIHTVYAIFFLASPDDNPTRHLRILAQLAGRVEDESFKKEWFDAKNEQELKESLLKDDRFESLVLKKGRKSEVFIDSMLREVKTPVGCLIALLQRRGRTLIPNGNTIFEEGDRLTVIGDKNALRDFKKTYIDD